jgi:hypothetical protein
MHLGSEYTDEQIKKRYKDFFNPSSGADGRKTVKNGIFQIQHVVKTAF